MHEVERVDAGEVLPSHPSREELIGAWANASQNILIEEFRRAKILYTARQLWGRAGFLDFAREVGLEKSAAYERLKLWTTYGRRIEDGDAGLSERLDNSPLDISHWIASTHAPEPLAMLDEAEDEKLGVRAMVARIHEKREAKQIEEAKANGRAVEIIYREEDEDVAERDAEVRLMVGAMLCPHCGKPIEGITRTEAK